MFAFGGVTIVQKLTRGWRCHIFARFARKNMASVTRGNFCTMVTAPNANIFGTLPYENCKLPWVEPGRWLGRVIGTYTDGPVAADEP